MIAAVQGGGCTLLKQECCTYIPVKSNFLHKAVHALYQDSVKIANLEQELWWVMVKGWFQGLGE